MKLLILGAGIGSESLENDLSIPKSLLPFDDHQLIMDYVISNAQLAGISEIIFVGGKNIIEVMDKYPTLKYYYAKDSEKKGNLHSLHVAKDSFDDDIVIVYADILFRESLFQKLGEVESEVVFAFDSMWKTRYEGRKSSYLKEAEKVYLKGNSCHFTKAELNNGSYELLGEFGGSVLFRKERLNVLSMIIDEIVAANPTATILDLLNRTTEEFSIKSVDLKGEWAELDSSQDINTFQFGTKADTLESLKLKLSKAKVLDQYSFTVRDWEADKENIVEKIIDSFPDANSVVVRSSAINEDTATASMAGNFESILDVSLSSRDDLRKAVNEVIKSYDDKETVKCLENQIFTQPFLDDIDISGVAFTRDIETKAPYYVINFDETTRRTDTVTSGNGASLKTYVVNRFNKTTKIEWLNALIEVLSEIEQITKDDFLDVEFAIKGSTIYLLQVRPIAAHKNELRVSDIDFTKSISIIKDFVHAGISSKAHRMYGNKTAYGIMPDWNPAEIIGVSPKPLALSLYKELITDHVWPSSRAFIGYNDIGHNFGLVSLGGRPYIDLRASFNTFTPSSLDPGIIEKLIDFYISFLEENKYLHDKVEFDVVLTAYSFDIPKMRKHLSTGKFTSDESDDIIESLRLFTKKLLTDKSSGVASFMDSLNTMEELFQLNCQSEMSTIERIYNLVKDCKKHGTFPFSVLARFSFVANFLMKSLVSTDVLEKSRLDEFFETISTIPKMLISDMAVLSESDLNKKYGHLRPGTYDIESLSYDESKQLFKKDPVGDTSTDVNFSWSKKEISDIEAVLRKSGFDLSFDQFIGFIKDAIEAREFSKFIFTKALSKILDLCTDIGISNGLPREDMAYLSIQDILKYYGESVSLNIHGELSEKIRYNKKQYLITHSLKLPPLIFSKSDIDYSLIEKEEPNFITNKKCVATVLNMDSQSALDKNLDNCLVLIEKADPGYDWIFHHNIKGLITKYGGVASHMAIRCAELGLPAAIGCGELIYEYAVKSHEIELDCATRQIIRVN